MPGIESSDAFFWNENSGLPAGTTHQQQGGGARTVTNGAPTLIGPLAPGRWRFVLFDNAAPGVGRIVPIVTEVGDENVVVDTDDSCPQEMVLNLQHGVLTTGDGTFTTVQAHFDILIPNTAKRYVSMQALLAATMRVSLKKLEVG